MHFDQWWNSQAADAFRAKHPDMDGEQFRPVWDAAIAAAPDAAKLREKVGACATTEGTQMTDADQKPAVAGLVESSVRQHTPGPWSVNYAKFSEVRAGNGAVIAKCNKLTNLVNLQANARLVAAAPDLLAFAQRFLDDHNSEDGMDSMKHYAREAYEAVRKATGAA